MTGPQRAPQIQRLSRPEDVASLRFVDGVAAVMVPGAMLRRIPFKHWRRQDSPRLAAVARSIRRWGYMPREPIVCRIGQKGRWIVLDGGHRLTAARRVAGAFWTNLLGPKVRDVYILLYEGPRSWGKSERPEAAGPQPPEWAPRSARARPGPHPPGPAEALRGCEGGC